MLLWDFPFSHSMHLIYVDEGISRKVSTQLPTVSCKRSLLITFNVRFLLISFNSRHNRYFHNTTSLRNVKKSYLLNLWCFSVSIKNKHTALFVLFGFGLPYLIGRSIFSTTTYLQKSNVVKNPKTQLQLLM